MMMIPTITWYSVCSSYRRHWQRLTNGSDVRMGVAVPFDAREAEWMRPRPEIEPPIRGSPASPLAAAGVVHDNDPLSAMIPPFAKATTRNHKQHDSRPVPPSQHQEHGQRPMRKPPSFCEIDGPAELAFHKVQVDFYTS